MNISNFVNQGWACRALSNKYLETPLCKTCAHTSLHFNRLTFNRIRLWKSIYDLIVMEIVFDPYMTSTWHLS